MHSAIIMSQEHSVLLFLCLLFRAENLGSVLSHGQAGRSAEEQLSSAASHAPGFFSWLYNTGTMIAGCKIDFEGHFNCELGSAFYFGLRRGEQGERCGELSV